MLELSVGDLELVTLDDGFVYFWPEANFGALSAHELREIADSLDRINKPWSDDIDKYFVSAPIATEEPRINSVDEAFL